MDRHPARWRAAGWIAALMLCAAAGVSRSAPEDAGKPPPAPAPAKTCPGVSSHLRAMGLEPCGLCKTGERNCLAKRCRGCAKAKGICPFCELPLAKAPRPKVPACPDCGSGRDVVEIAYETIDEDRYIRDEIEVREGKIGINPRWRCRKCGTGWGKIELVGAPPFAPLPKGFDEEVEEEKPEKKRWWPFK